MFVVNRILGNVHRDQGLQLEVQRREKLGEVETVTLSFHDAGRRRLRATTSADRSVGVDLGNDDVLKDGDVLVAGEDTDTLVLVEVAPSEAMALRLSDELPVGDLFLFGVKLGHVLGNQHWPLTVKDGSVLTPVTIDRKVMETVIKTHAFKGIEWEFIPVEPGDVPTAMPHINHDHS